MEKAYDFRKNLLEIHEPDIRDYSRQYIGNEFFLGDKVTVVMSDTACDVVRTAVFDFTEFLKVSMGILSTVCTGYEAGEITVSLASDAGIDLGEYATYKGFAVITDSSGIHIYGHDACGIAQGLYYLEDIMSFEHAPVVAFGSIYKKPMFSPQMVHSGYGLDNYPDEYLARIAHEGRDAILVFTKDVNQTPEGFLDFNELIARASKYGIDVYAYSYMISDKHPDDPEAEEHYESTYGRLFKECPGLKGVTLVGESVEFPSKDSNVSPGRKNKTFEDGIPTGKFTAGWWPCCDYPDWINIVKKTVRKYKADADIVFWTYNWGGRPKEARLNLIENLPTDITLLATFEMFEQRIYGNSKVHIADYSLAFEGPGGYFCSEAEAASKRGIKLYSMTNTGGLTWDFGMIPYEPMPYQWMKRFDAMRMAYDKWNLSGIMETHHYGFYPSFISKLGKWSFWEPREDMNVVLKRILTGYFGKENYEKVSKGLRYISDAITYYTPTDADQYCAFRVGPAYPFNLDKIVNVPSDPKAMFGNRIVLPVYSDYATNILDAPRSIRIKEELKSLETMLENISKGVGLLEETENTNKNLIGLINLVRYMKCCVITGIHSKKWHILKTKMWAAESREELSAIYDDMETLLKDEVKNSQSAIPYVEADSRLGWEPSMLYIGDSWHINWKLKHSKYVLEKELPMLRMCLENLN